MSEHLWYYELLDETHGPVSTDDIQQMVAEGQLTEEDRIRPQSSEEWITVTDLKTLVENVASGDDEWEEVTDLDDLNFTFEDSSAGLARTSEVVEVDDDRHSGLDINSFQLIGDPEEERHSAFDPVSGRSTAPIWMTQSLGQVLGPMTISELIGMAEAGALAGSDDVRKQYQENWSRADSLPEVKEALARGAAGVNAAKTKSSPPSGAKTGIKRKSKPSSKSASGNPTGRKRRRKKKRSKKDQLLAEIFSDVFSEDGQVRDLSERPDLAKSAAPASAGVASASSATAAPPPLTSPGLSSPGLSSPGAGFSGASMPTAPGMGAASTSGYPAAAPGMPGAPSAGPAFIPPSRKKKRRSGGSSLPEPPVLAAIVGVLLIVLIGAIGFMGWIDLPGFGMSADSLFTNFEAEFPSMLSEELPAPEWETFRGKFLTGARGVAKSHTASAGSNPESAKVLNKALLIVRILEIPLTATKSREAYWEKYQGL